jgi:hypothetical protein
VTRSQADDWSIARSLAFLAATLAIVFGTLLPSAVAASAASGSPIVLCSGHRIMVVHDADGAPQPLERSPIDSLKCASCVLADLTPLPPPPPVRPVAPPRIVTVQPDLPATRTQPPPIHAGLPPPSTAPPAA